MQEQVCLWFMAEGGRTDCRKEGTSLHRPSLVMSAEKLEYTAEHVGRLRLILQIFPMHPMLHFVVRWFVASIMQRGRIITKRQPGKENPTQQDYSDSDHFQTQNRESASPDPFTESSDCQCNTMQWYLMPMHSSSGSDLCFFPILPTEETSWSLISTRDRCVGYLHGRDWTG